MARAREETESLMHKNMSSGDTSLATGTISLRPGMCLPVDDVRNVTFINPRQGAVSTHVPFELMYGTSEATINGEYELMDRWGRARLRLFGGLY